MRKSFVILGMFTVLVIGGSYSARAQIIDTIDVSIPFSFTVHNTTLPAGKYTIDRVGFAQEVMAIRDEDGHTSALFLTNGAVMGKEPKDTELIFQHLGGEYFLSKIFEQGSRIGVELPKPRAERELEKEGSTVRIETVTVSATLNVQK